MGELDAEVTVVVQLDDADRERIDTPIKALAKVETLFEVGGRWFVRRADGRGLRWVGVGGGVMGSVKRRDEAHVVRWLRLVADQIESGRSPYLLASNVPEREPDKPCADGSEETFSVTMSPPWGG